MAYFGLVTLPRHYLAAKSEWATPGNWDPTSIRVDLKSTPLIPHAVQLPLDFLMVSTPAVIALDDQRIIGYISVVHLGRL